jgi:hypothetical protein
LRSEVAFCKRGVIRSKLRDALDIGNPIAREFGAVK